MFTITPIFDVQSDLLGIIGQEAVAHAALIFASLTATFAFATGFKKKVGDPLSRAIYVGFLGPLIGIAVYAFLRMYLWGTLLGAVLNNPLDLALTKCKPLPQLPAGSLSLYWVCVDRITSSTLWFPYITVRTLSAFSFSLWLGFLISLGLLTLALDRQQRESVKKYRTLVVIILVVSLVVVFALCYSTYPYGPFVS